MKRTLFIVTIFLVSAAISGTRAQHRQNFQGVPMGFPFQLKRDVTRAEVADRIDHHFGYRQRIFRQTDSVWAEFHLMEPLDSLFFDGIGPAKQLYYTLFRDTLKDLAIDFGRGGTQIDTAHFLQTYSYTDCNCNGDQLTIRDSSFAMVIVTQMNGQGISFFDTRFDERIARYRDSLAKELAKDSVVVVATARNKEASMPPRTTQGSKNGEALPLLLGERMSFENLQTTVEFHSIGVRKSRRGKEITAEDATLFLTIDHNGQTREVTIGTGDRRCLYCDCFGIADDLP